MILVDTHVHLQSRQYAQDLDRVLKQAARDGVYAAVVAGSDLESSREAVRLAERYATGPFVIYATIGYHPTSAAELTPQTLAELRELAHHRRVAAIGEIGLDYYWPNNRDRDWECATPAQQRLALEKQLALAAEVKLPVVFHDRDAHADSVAVLRDWVKGGPGRSGTLHAYAGGPEWLEQVMDLGFHIGMDGPVTFASASDLHDVARQVPLERLLLETDGPYLTPHPYRGKRNQPAYLVYVAQRIAELRGIAPDAVARATTQNAQQLFRLAPPKA